MEPNRVSSAQMDLTASRAHPSSTQSRMTRSVRHVPDPARHAAVQLPPNAHHVQQDGMLTALAGVKSVKKPTHARHVIQVAPHVICARRNTTRISSVKTRNADRATKRVSGVMDQQLRTARSAHQTSM